MDGIARAHPRVLHVNEIYACSNYLSYPNPAEQLAYFGRFLELVTVFVECTDGANPRLQRCQQLSPNFQLAMAQAIVEMS